MGFIDSVFGEEDEQQFRQVPQSAEATAARKRLSAISEGPLPTVPLRGVAAPGELGEERTLARETATARAKELASPVDIFSLPEVQGVIQEVTARGDLLANRLGRGLQKSGTFTTTQGRDVLGRAVTDVQKNLASSLGSFANAERNRRANAIPQLISQLEGLGLTEELRGQAFDQASLDALFSKESTESNQLQSFLIPLLQSIIGLQPQQISVTEPGRMGILEMAGQVASTVKAFTPTPAPEK